MQAYPPWSPAIGRPGSALYARVLNNSSESYRRLHESPRRDQFGTGSYLRKN